MTTKKRVTRKGEVKKLKLKKETIRDLDAKRKSGGVKGGAKATVGNDWNCGGGGTKGNDWNCGGTVGNCW